MSRHLAVAVVLGALCAALSTGCASQTTVLAGPALAYPDGRASLGVAATIAHGVELSPPTTSGPGEQTVPTVTTLGPTARVLVTERTKHVRAGVALQRISWLGSSQRVLFDTTMPVGLGVERFDGQTGGTAGLGLGLRMGVTVGETSRVVSVLSPWAEPVDPSRDASSRPPRSLVHRERTVVVLGPAADIDFRFSREPLGTLSLSLGLQFVDEWLAEPTKAHR